MEYGAGEGGEGRREGGREGGREGDLQLMESLHTPLAPNTFPVHVHV